MLLSELIKNLKDALEQQGDGTIVIDVPERESFTSLIEVCDKYYQGNSDYLVVGEGLKPYCFLVVGRYGADE